MNIVSRIRKLISYLAIFIMLCIQITPVHAAMVNNNDILRNAQHNTSVKQMVTILDREEIHSQLTDMGISPSEAKDRIKRMTDSELAELTQTYEQQPAGSGVLGAVVTIFVVLVITDMLGATDVFPFVKNINR
ncbi:MAG: PA2779 family protein [Gammaproteobacteria bacterium]|nr:PA2779 family protein [Gammaproteobacteria bacterium]